VRRALGGLACQSQPEGVGGYSSRVTRAPRRGTFMLLMNLHRAHVAMDRKFYRFPSLAMVSQARREVRR
jgi:hypothetical protein